MKDKIISWCRDNYIFLILLALLIFLANLFLYQFYRQERYIYFWDWSAYQSHFIFAVGKLRLGIFPALGALLYSIAFTEYSLLAPFIISPLGIIFGTGRAVFLFSVLNIFALPAGFLLGLVFARLIGATGKRKWLFVLLPMGILFLTPQFWIPLLLGFFDVATVIGIALIWLLLASDQNIKTLQKAACVGLLLTLLIFTRRWFGYWSFSFFPAIFIQWLYSKIKKQKPFWELKTIFICGLFSAGFLFIFGAPIAKQMLTDNYASMFQAFKGGNSTWQVILAAAYHFGWLILLFSAAGFIWSTSQPRLRDFTKIVFLQTLIALLLFARVQLIDLHHYYQFIPVVVLFESLFIFYFWQTQINPGTFLRDIKPHRKTIISFIHIAELRHILEGARIKKFWKILVSVLFTAILFFNFAQALIPQFNLNFNPLHLTANARHFPLIRNDQVQIASLMTYLDQTMAPGTTLYVDSSSLILNDDVVRNSCRYLNLPEIRVCNNIIFASNVDLRDGFPRQFINADFILVPNPPQIHLRPVDQRVIWVLEEKLLDQNSIGSAYSALSKEFILDGGVKVKILKRIRALTPSELDNLSKTFLEFYPTRADLFQIQQPSLLQNSQAGSLTFIQKIKASLKKIIGTNDIKSYFREKLGGSDITGETVY